MTWHIWWWAAWFVFTRVWVLRAANDWRTGDTGDGWLPAVAAMSVISIALALMIGAWA